MDVVAVRTYDFVMSPHMFFLLLKYFTLGTVNKFRGEAQKFRDCHEISSSKFLERGKKSSQSETFSSKFCDKAQKFCNCHKISSSNFRYKAQ